jgi:hypothetical protein
VTWKKDPDDIEDFWFDWGSDEIAKEDRFLPAGLTIASAVVDVPTGLTHVLDDFTSKVVRVRVSGGGAVGQKYDIGCLITTSDGQVFEQTQRLEIKERKSI